MAAGTLESQQKVLKYEEFLNNVLRQDLKKVLGERDKIFADSSEYLVLKNTILRLQESNFKNKVLKTKVDLGCNFYANAIVPDCQLIFVKIGFGFFLELTLDEALKFIEKKNKQLESVAASLTEDSVKIKANIRMVLEGLRELQLPSTNEPKERNRRDI